jgi:hypothetical protein
VTEIHALESPDKLGTTIAFPLNTMLMEVRNCGNVCKDVVLYGVV